jgi:pyridoxamine 5'-phosphate oxidase
MFDNLDDVRRDWMTRVVTGARDRKSAMHTPVVVTSNIDARVMVLRSFDEESAVLRFHTDIRSPKVAAIAADPAAAVLLYDNSAKVQIRARGRGRVEQAGPVADAAWAASTNFARRCYLGEGPGSVSEGPTSGLPSEFEGVEPDDEQLIPARENFAVMLIEVKEIDWLYLSHTGHLCAHFTRAGDVWEGRWVTP